MLYVVATPIGNLADISERAIKVLSGVDLILAEDTRNSRKLLDRFNISTKLESFHEHSSESKLLYYVGLLTSGTDIAYISDAGTPNISDPGGKLIASVLDAGVTVSPIPGSSSLTALISVAPFSCSEFVFKGFFPKKKGRQTLIKQLANVEVPTFFLESPMRIKKTLKLLADSLPSRHIVLGRELTKIYEQIILLDLGANDIDEKIESLVEKGEFIFAIYRQ